MEVILALGVIVGIAAAAMILRGWVLSVMWGWFIVPAFGLPALSIPIAIGIAMIMSYLTHQIEPDDSSTAKAAGHAFGGPIMVLLLGWIVQMFI
jgi:hypothetical protein